MKRILKPEIQIFVLSSFFEMYIKKIVIPFCNMNCNWRPGRRADGCCRTGSEHSCIKSFNEINDDECAIMTVIYNGIS